MIQCTNVFYFLLDYDGPMDYEGPFLNLEAVIMKVHPLKSNAVIMKVPRHRVPRVDPSFNISNSKKDRGFDSRIYVGFRWYALFCPP